MKVRTIVFAVSLLIFSELSWSQNSTDEALNSDETQIESYFSEFIEFLGLELDPTREPDQEYPTEPTPGPAPDKDTE